MGNKIASKTHSYGIFVLSLTSACSVLEEGWLEFPGISCCLPGTFELSRELLLPEGREEKLVRLLWLPDDLGPASAIHHPGRVDSECCLGALIFSGSCSESFPGSR